jgi:hypothetical protein
MQNFALTRPLIYPFFFLFLFNQILLSCSGEYKVENYKTCQKKLNDANVFSLGTTSLPLKNKKRLLYIGHEHKHLLKNFNVIKYDPFLGLALINDKNAFKYPFLFASKQSCRAASIAKETVMTVEKNHKQIGLNQLSGYVEPLYVPSVLTDSCCSLQSLVTPRGVIEKAYLENFINRKNMIYADAGIRLINKNKKILISDVDPFIIKNEFTIGDELLKIDGQKVISASLAMQKILFSKVGKKVIFTVRHNKKERAKTILLKKRLGGGLLSDTFLEHRGLFFDKNFTLIKDVKQLQLKKGDTLYKLNNREVSEDNDIRKHFKPYSNNHLLIKRNGFQFFVVIKALYSKKNTDPLSKFETK